jgi:cell division protein FtsW
MAIFAAIAGFRPKIQVKGRSKPVKEESLPDRVKSVLTATKDNTLANDILLVVSLLMGIGTVFVFSASANVSQELDLHRFYDFQSLRQILFFPVALLVMYAASCVDYRRLSFGKRWFRSPTSYLLAVSIILLIVVLIPGIGTEINQARRWLRIPVGPVSVSFQPSELAKWAVLIFLAAFCEKRGDGLGPYWRGFVPACAVIAGVVGLIIIEDFGTAALVAFLGLLMLLMGGAKWWHVVSLVPFGAVGFCMALLSSPTRWRRIAAFFWPHEWAGTAAYQANQSLIALGSGGLWGR